MTAARPRQPGVEVDRVAPPLRRRGWRARAAARRMSVPQLADEASMALSRRWPSARPPSPAAARRRQPWPHRSSSVNASMARDHRSWRAGSHDVDPARDRVDQLRRELVGRLRRQANVDIASVAGGAQVVDQRRGICQPGRVGDDVARDERAGHPTGGIRARQADDDRAEAVRGGPLPQGRHPHVIGRREPDPQLVPGLGEAEDAVPAGVGGGGEGRPVRLWARRRTRRDPLRAVGPARAARFGTIPAAMASRTRSIPSPSRATTIERRRRRRFRFTRRRAACSPAPPAWRAPSAATLLGRLAAVGVADDLGVQRRLVGVVDAGEALDLAGHRLPVEALDVALGAAPRAARRT